MGTHAKNIPIYYHGYNWWHHLGFLQELYTLCRFSMLPCKYADLVILDWQVIPYCNTASLIHQSGCWTNEKKLSVFLFASNGWNATHSGFSSEKRTKLLDYFRKSPDRWHRGHHSRPAEPPGISEVWFQVLFVFVYQQIDTIALWM